MNEFRGEVFVPALREKRLVGKKIVLVLQSAPTELIHLGNGVHALADIKEHGKLIRRLSKPKNEDASTAGKPDAAPSAGTAKKIDENLYQPKLLHKLLRCLSESAIWKYGYLLLYLRTLSNELIEISPQWNVPQSYGEFESTIATLMIAKIVRAKQVKLTLLRIVKNDLSELMPSGCRKVGIIWSSNDVTPNKDPLPLTSIIEALDRLQTSRVDTMQRAVLERLERLGENKSIEKLRKDDALPANNSALDSEAPGTKVTSHEGVANRSEMISDFAALKERDARSHKHIPPLVVLADIDPQQHKSQSLHNSEIEEQFFCTDRSIESFANSFCSAVADLWCPAFAA